MSGFKKSHKSQVQDDSHWGKAGLVETLSELILGCWKMILWAEEGPDSHHLLDDSVWAMPQNN